MSSSRPCSQALCRLVRKFSPSGSHQQNFDPDDGLSCSACLTGTCACRHSFQELVLTDSGRVRWNRIENLVAESSKSVGYDRSQLWRVADWIFGDPGAAVRKPVAAELARLIDSAVAGVLTSLPSNLGS